MPSTEESRPDAGRPETTARLQEMVLDSPDVHAFLASLAGVAAESFAVAFGEVFCSISLLHPGMNSTVASSSLQAQATDEVQHTFDDGPCLLAARSGHVVMVADFATETRFPQYRDAIAVHGIRSALGVPIRLDNEASAALDFYSSSPDAFDARAIAVAEGFAREASRSLRLAVKMATLSDAVNERARIVACLTTIDLARGVIMARNGCTQDQALDFLSHTSVTRGIDLRDLAAALLDTVGGGTAPTTHAA